MRCVLLFCDVVGAVECSCHSLCCVLVSHGKFLVDADVGDEVERLRKEWFPDLVEEVFCGDVDVGVWVAWMLFVDNFDGSFWKRFLDDGFEAGVSDAFLFPVHGSAVWAGGGFLWKFAEGAEWSVVLVFEDRLAGFAAENLFTGAALEAS